jgi:high-affinity iron transporter
MGAFLLFLLPAVALADASQRLVQMLDYIGVDYPPTVENGEVVDEVEYAEMQEFSVELEKFLSAMPDNPSKASLFKMATQIQQGISQRVHGDEIAVLTQTFKADLIESYRIVVGPKKAPDMNKVQALYETACSSCHGLLGYGDGPLASGLEIKPSSFHDMDRQYSRSIYDLYNTITLGVSGTPMQGFPQLSEDERWALAFMISRFSGADEQVDAGKLLWQQGQLHTFFQTLSDLTGMSYAKADELGEDAGIDGQAVLVYLRSNPEILEVSDNAALDTSIAMLATSLEHARAGNTKAAHKAALSAYLDGFELAEPSLVVVDKQLKKAIEKEMILFRELSKLNRVGELEVLQEKLVSLLSEAKETISSSQMSPAAAFAGSFIILLREGVEAILVLAAIMTALVKTGRREAMKFIHLGWVGAIILGVATWWVAENLISVSGASREMTEGIAALFAAMILLYVGFWLHNASHSKRWKKYVEHKVDNAMEGSTLWVLGTVTFIAVYREMFETVLFYQAMWAQIDTAKAEQGFLLGILAAVALLVILAFVILRIGTRLPIKQFFQINAVLLFMLAVIFSGQGIAALQEAGVVATSILDIPSVELLGIYPTLQSLGLQIFVLLIGVGLLSYQRKKA